MDETTKGFAKLLARALNRRRQNGDIVPESQIEEALEEALAEASSEDDLAYTLRRGPIAAATVAALSALALLVGAGSAQADPASFATYPQLDRIAQLVSGHAAASVRCPATAAVWNSDPVVVGARKYLGRDLGGYHPDGAEFVVLAPRSCRDLLGLIRKPSVVSDGAAVALLLLDHEASHIGGYVDEHETDCRALLVFRYTALKVGVSRADTEAMFGIAQAVHNSAPAPYGGACR